MVGRGAYSAGSLFSQTEAVTRAETRLEEGRRPTATEMTLIQDGDTIAQDVRFVHEVCTEHDGTTWIRV